MSITDPAAVWLPLPFVTSARVLHAWEQGSADTLRKLYADPHAAVDSDGEPWGIGAHAFAVCDRILSSRRSREVNAIEPAAAPAGRDTCPACVRVLEARKRIAYLRGIIDAGGRGAAWARVQLDQLTEEDGNPDDEGSEPSQ